MKSWILILLVGSLESWVFWYYPPAGVKEDNSFFLSGVTFTIALFSFAELVYLMIKEAVRKGREKAKEKEVTNV